MIGAALFATIVFGGFCLWEWTCERVRRWAEARRDRAYELEWERMKRDLAPRPRAVPPANPWRVR